MTDDGAREKAGEPAPAGRSAEELVDRFGEVLDQFRAEVGHVIVGQERVIDELLIALLCGGHAMIEGVPGLAKTLLIHSMASALSLDFGRIQFTPDLMPSDVTGTLVVREDLATGARDFRFRKGPIFTNVLLADEINRTPPKTQAALLEGMSEGFVTAGGKRHTIPDPFFVLATQNPIEQEGTYTLPEAQLDRFLLKVLIDYPEAEDEAEVLRRTTGTRSGRVSEVLTRDDILALQRVVLSLPVSDHVRVYAARMVRSTRPEDPLSPPWVKELFAWGAGPRASQSLILAAKALTLLRGRFAVTRGDVRDIALPVLRHRILPSFFAEGQGYTADDLVTRLLLELTAFPPSDEHDEITREILRL